jgi:DNA invertase Pin-like site-specific DNA recombinase
MLFPTDAQKSRGLSIAVNCSQLQSTAVNCTPRLQFRCAPCTRAEKISLRATEQPIDTSTAAGKCFLDMLGVFAEFETNLRRERQLEGIAKAKAAGVYKGRPPSIDVTKVRQLKAKGMGVSEIAKALKIGRASVYRVLGERK